VAPLVLALLSGACARRDPVPEKAAGPATTVAPISAPTPLADTRQVVLAGVAGREPPAEPVEIRGGDADVVGTVTGPDGPVPDSLVLLERFVDDRRGSLTVRTDRQGRFRALKVFGGRYRVRAWRSPDLSLTVPERLFLRNDGETTLDLTMTSHDGLTVQAAASSTAPLVGETAVVTALVTRQVVDGRGIVLAPAADGERVVLEASPGWSVAPPTDRTVGTDGRATWSVRCTEAGSGRLRVRAGAAATVIDTGCRNPVDEPVEPDVEAPDPDFPVGTRFSPPWAAPLPAGSYRVVESPGTCGISFQQYVGGAWEDSRRTATGTVGFDVATPFRDVRVIGDSPPCLYERVS
jgi:hypothetical protein